MCRCRESASSSSPLPQVNQDGSPAPSAVPSREHTPITRPRRSSIMSMWTLIFLQRAIRAHVVRKRLDAFNVACGLIADGAPSSPLKKQVMTQQERVVTTMEKPKELRTQVDVSHLVFNTRAIKFFKSVSTEVHRALMAKLDCKLVLKDSTLTVQGEEGHTFYILFRGGVKVYVNDAERKWKNYCVGTMEEGDAFGELALLNADGRRTATVVVSEPSIMFTLNAEDYRRILRPTQESDLRFKVSFLENIFLFREWRAIERERLALCLYRRLYERNQVVIREGQATELFYLVARGQCRVLKWMSLSRDQEAMLTRSHAPAHWRTDAEGAQPLLADLAPIEFSSVQTYGYFGELPLLDLSLDRQHSTANQPKTLHSATVVTATPAIIFTLSKQDFLVHIAPRCGAVLRAYANEYYVDDARIGQIIRAQHEWARYKQHIVQDAVHGRPHLDEPRLSPTKARGKDTGMRKEKRKDKNKLGDGRTSLSIDTLRTLNHQVSKLALDDPPPKGRRSGKLASKSTPSLTIRQISSCSTKIEHDIHVKLPEIRPRGGQGKATSSPTSNTLPAVS